MGEAVNSWRQEGAVHLWRFRPERRGLAGWHLAGDAAGLAGLARLVGLMRASAHKVKRTVGLAPPPPAVSRIPFGDPEGRKLVVAASLHVAFDPAAPPGRWTSELAGDRLRLDLGLASLAELEEGLKSRRRGEWDFSIGPADGDPPHNIWFW